MAGLQDIIERLREHAASLAPEVGGAFMRDLDRLNDAVYSVAPWTEQNEALTSPLRPAEEAVKGAVGSAVSAIPDVPISTIDPDTAAALRGSGDGDDGRTLPATEDDAPRSPRPYGEMDPASSAAMLRNNQRARDAKLAEIVARAQDPRRADRDPEKLAASLANPLVSSVDANGQPVPFAYERTKVARPWGEMDPTPTIVGYSEDDVLEPSTWGSPEKVGRLQHRLVNAGFLSSDFKFGFYDETTEKAYRDLLTFSTKNGVSMLEGLVEAHKARKWAAENGVPWEQIGGAADGGSSALKPPKYQAPDKATVREFIRAQFKEELGRDPEPGELQRYASQYLADDRQGFQAQVDAAMPDEPVVPDNVFDDAPSLMDGESGDPAAVEDTGPQIDPQARFAESFNNKYRVEREFKERQAENAEQTGLLAGILGSLDEVA